VLIICSSVKGGSGTSVVAASLAIAALHLRAEASVLVVDLDGDQPAVLGLPEPERGLTEWSSGCDGLRFDDIIERHDRMQLVGRGRGNHRGATHESDPRFDERLGEELVRASADGRTVVVDAGRWSHDIVPDDASALRLLVVQPCYLALRRVVEARPRVDGLVVITPPDRVLTVNDVATVAERPVLARVPLHPDVSRRVDAGLLRSRPPRPIDQPLTSLLVAASRS